MCPRYHPKTLARTLATMLVHSPGEHGLFWDPDGSMPWKDFYWVLQQDSSLRFVRGAHLKEIAYLGIDFPVFLDGTVLRLKEGLAPPEYPPAAEPPKRLYFGCPRRHVPTVREGGLKPSRRSFLTLWEDRDLALRSVRRHDPDGVVLEVVTEKALTEGVVFLWAGGPLYLVRALSPSCLVLPLLRAETPPKGAEKKTSGKSTGVPVSPGSFFVSGADLPRPVGAAPGGEDSAGRRGPRGKRGSDWKRMSRKERTKRDI